MTRFRLDIEYNGEPFVGWQRQDNGPSVQATIEAAIERFCGETITVHGAGRTDAGVHALAQVAHVDIAKETTPPVLSDALNHHLRPAPVTVLRSRVAPPQFDARRSAIGRSYLYRILNRRAPPSLERGRVWWVPSAMDHRAMHAAAQRLTGRHDFSSFCAGLCQAEPALKTLDRLDVSRDGDEIRIVAEARSFQHNQVRIFAGTLKLVGTGKWSDADVAQALAACDRRAGGPTAPAAGLYLTEVRYPPDNALARRSAAEDQVVADGGDHQFNDEAEQHNAGRGQARDVEGGPGDEPGIDEYRHLDRDVQ